MNREETEDIARFILDIRDEPGITITEGLPEEVQRHAGVAEAYLGTHKSAGAKASPAPELVAQ